MNAQSSVLSTEVYRYLKMVLSKRHATSLDKESIRMLQQKLEHAQVVSLEDVPADVVCLNSRVHLHDLEEDKTESLILVHPSDVASGKGNLSLLAPWGLAILGCREGEIVEWPFPWGCARIRIVKIAQQPEGKPRRAAMAQLSIDRPR
jgi:regulator of nucleoside diphosphate kinase